MKWLEELRNESLAFPSDPLGGASANMWCLSFPPEDTLVAGDLVEFLVDVAAVRRELVAAHNADPVTFYAWHDEVAGQLRFSTARCSPDSLPFGYRVRLVDDPAEIVEDFLASPYRDGIPWTDVDDESDSAEVARNEQGHLMVWAQLLTQETRPQESLGE